MFDKRTDFDIVKVGLFNGTRYTDATAIPRYLEFGVSLVDILCQLVDSLRIGITTHKGDARNVIAIFLYKSIDCIGIQGKPDVFPEVMAMAAWAATGAIRDIDCQRHLIGYLLEYDACVYILQHLAISI